MTVHTQGDEALANQYTRFLGYDGSGVWVNIIFDRSQCATNWTEATSGAYVTNSSLIMGTTRTVRMRFVGGADGHLYEHWSGGIADSTDREGLDSDSTNLYVEYVTDGSGTYGVIGTIPWADIGGGADTFLLGWVTRPNLTAAGASDAAEHLLYIYNETDGDWYRYRFTSYARDAGSGTNETIFGDADHTGPDPYDADIYLCAWDHEVLTAAYMRQVHVGAPSAPTTETVQPLPTRPIRRSSGFGDQDQYFGPQALIAGDHHLRAIRRTFSPLVCENYEDPGEVNSVATGNFPWVGSGGGAEDGWLQLPDTVYYVHKGWVRCRPVPIMANRLFVRIHVRSYSADATPIPVGIRVYSMDYRPGSPLVGERYFAGTIITRDDDASVGQWSLNKLIPIAQCKAAGLGQMTYLFPAIAIDPNNDNTNDINAHVLINAWSVHPRYVEPASGGLPFGGFAP